MSTPGPWTLSSDDRIFAGGEPILWGWDDGSIVGDKEDLRLIAAAPELLEAARWVLHNAHGVSRSGEDHVSDEEYRAAFDSLKAACVKAEGR